MLSRLNLKFFYIMVLLVILSIMFVDKNLSIFIHEHKIDTFDFFKIITNGLPYIVFLIAVIYIVYNKPLQLFSNRFSALAYLGFVIILTMAFKSLFKYIFARIRPLSLFENDLYGFYYFFNASSIKVNFPSGHSMFSFPSGHTTFIAAIAITMLFIYPKSKMKVFWIGCTIAMIISLVALNYHFLADCFASLALVSILSVVAIIVYRVLIFIIFYKFLTKRLMK